MEWMGYLGYVQLNHPKFEDVLDELKISDYEFRMLELLFHEVDIDDSNTVDIDEFFQYFGFTMITPLSARYFDVFDVNGTLELDLISFIVTIWQLGTNSEEAMIQFAFDIYDEDNSKKISWDESYKMLIESYGGEKHMTTATRKAVQKLKIKYEDAMLDAFLDGEENVVMGMCVMYFLCLFSLSLSLSLSAFLLFTTNTNTNWSPPNQV